MRIENNGYIGYDEADKISLSADEYEMLTDILYEYREQKLAQLINNYLDYKCEEELYDFIRETIRTRQEELNNEQRKW